MSARDTVTEPVEQDPGETYRILDDDGHVVDGREPPALSDEELLDIYRQMQLARLFDERAVSLQRQGRVGTYPPLSGQEGAQVGSAFALADRDWIVPSYREHGVAMARGFPLERILLYWMGHEVGNRIPEELNMLPIAVPIATQIPHATGAAWASKLRGNDEVFCCYFGDGATSEGDFHEGLNFAGVYDVPAVFFCSNNQWAISMPRERQTGSQTLAQKAVAYGFDGVQVDGMDPLAVYEVTRAAVEKARNPRDGEHRPTLIEAVQYRFGAHTTADDPTAYRDDEEVERWKAKDPIPRLETFLRRSDRLDDEKIQRIETEIETRVSDAIEAAEAFEPPGAEEIFEHVYEDEPRRLAAQREALEAARSRHGDDAFLEG